MNSPRIHRLFDPVSKRCLDVAVDHGFFNEPSFLQGIAHMPSVIATLVEAAPDAIQLSPGQARILQSMPVRPRPALVLRTDIANIYGSNVPDRPFSELIEDAVSQAVRLDAACVVVNLLDIDGRPELHRSCVRNVMALRAACDQAAMPLMVEPLVMRPDGGAYTGVHDVGRIKGLARQAVELGADVVKADPSDPADRYGEVIEACAPIPVLVRGGGKVESAELFRRTAAVLEQGAAGIVYGRNIIQHPKPAAITQALMGILHRGWTPEEAVEHLEAA
ncbi:MAG: aldolase [Gammaproteobacteria bacterium]|nr:aldolase [Gammaproteobacteria bacterium]